MHRSRGLIAAMGLLACVTACSEGTTAAPPPAGTTPSSPPSSSATTAPTTPTTTSVTRPASPEKLTEACAFLGGEELTAALGVSQRIRSQEEPEKSFGVVTNFQCSYGDLAVLTISAVPDDVTPKSLTEGKRKSCAGTITPLTAGAGGWFCTTRDGFAKIITGKTGHGQVRILELNLIKPSDRPDAYETLAKLVVDRL
ncbi:hypothetical protein [Amycolatopsis sp. NPDC059657]|uniref:hypothetical protein n=1 Tax=Amycolatopsis sp. NPDC059657 TaxID=3346899 RepID=UPI00366F3023